MTGNLNWRKSSFSDGSDGDRCVEIAELPTHIAVRDSKAPERAVLSFPRDSFTALVDLLKGM